MDDAGEKVAHVRATLVTKEERVLAVEDALLEPAFRDVVIPTSGSTSTGAPALRRKSVSLSQ